MVHDGASDELREEGYEQHVVDEVQQLDPVPVRVDEERDLLKGEKRDADRQHHRAEDEVEAGDRVEVVHEEVGVLEVAQRGEVEHDAEHQQRPGRVRPPTVSRHDASSQGEVHQHQGHDQQQVDRIPPAVEDEREEREETD